MKMPLISILPLLFLGSVLAAHDLPENEEKESVVHAKVVPVTAKAEQPALPRNLLKPGESAEIVVFCAIDEKGKLVNARTKSATHKELEKVVIESLEKWEFEPALLDGKPVKSRVEIPFKFVLARH